MMVVALLLALPWASRALLAREIPVVHTPPGGYGNALPAPVLKDCTEALVAGAPELRGLWRVRSGTRGGRPLVAGDALLHYVERIEQCGDRIIDSGGGTVSDGRADGSAANGVHDVSVFDYATPLHVLVSYEAGTTYVLQPTFATVFNMLLARLLGTGVVHVPLALLPFPVPGLRVTRELTKDGLMRWRRPDEGFEVLLERIGGPNEPYVRMDLPSSSTGGSGIEPRPPLLGPRGGAAAAAAGLALAIAAWRLCARRSRPAKLSSKAL
jgi:hypothetical protein